MYLMWKIWHPYSLPSSQLQLIIKTPTTACNFSLTEPIANPIFMCPLVICKCTDEIIHYYTDPDNSRSGTDQMLICVN